MIRIIGCGEKVSFGTVVNSSKSVQLVFRFSCILQRFFFCNNDSLLSKHVINFVADIDARVICLILQFVYPNDFNVIVRYVEVKVKLNLIKKKFCRYDYSNLLIFIQEILSQHHNDESFSSAG